MTSYLIAAAVIAVVLTWRWRQVGRARRLRLETLWLIPVLYAVVAVIIFWKMPPHGMAWLWCAIGGMVGAGLGWMRGRMMAISVDPETHSLNQTTSPAAMLFIVALILARLLSRSLAASLDGPGHAGILLVTDILVAFALGFLSAQRIEMFLRARRLLAQARAR